MWKLQSPSCQLQSAVECTRPPDTGCLSCRSRRLKSSCCHCPVATAGMAAGENFGTQQYRTASRRAVALIADITSRLEFLNDVREAAVCLWHQYFATRSFEHSDPFPLICASVSLACKSFDQPRSAQVSCPWPRLGRVTLQKQWPPDFRHCFCHRTLSIPAVALSITISWTTSRLTMSA